MEPGATTAKARPSADGDAEAREAVEQEVAAEQAAISKAAERPGDVTEEEARGALSYLLGARKPLPYEVKTTYETEHGPKPLTFVIRQVDGRKIDAIEGRHRDRTTGILDQIGADVSVAAEGLIAIEDESGARVAATSEEFRTVHPEQPPLASPIDALTARFATQLGILSGVAREVRRVSGWAPERVGQAERRLVDAAGG